MILKLMEYEPLRIYISATKQKDGQTTTALGLLNAIAEKYPRFGYIKLVGQQVQLIGDQQIDKDVSLMSEVYHIGGQLNNMSPVAIPRWQKCLILPSLSLLAAELEGGSIRCTGPRGDCEQSTSGEVGKGRGNHQTARVY